MEDGSLQSSKSARLLVALLILANQSSGPALAARLPQGGLAIQRLLGEGRDQVSGRKQNRYNLSYMPVLLDLARVLGRFQAPPHLFFYIENESFSNYPGIDLRSLLFRHCGPLKVPEGLDEPDSGMPAQGPDQPVLAVPPLDPDASGDGGSKMNDGSVPQLAVQPLSSDSSSVQPTKPKTEVASPDQIKVAVHGNQLSGGPSLSFDFHGISRTLEQSDSQLNYSALDIPHLRTSFPTLIAFGEAVHNVTPFLFWTCHATPAKAPAQAPGDSSLKGSTAFKGTFVACREATGISWIRNRHIGLQHGRMLAVNRGGDLGVDTALGSVSIDPGASAIVEYNEKKILRIMALESSAPGRVIVDVRKPDGTGHSVRLLQGEALIVGEHNLAKEDIEGSDRLALVDPQEQERTVRARFTLNDLLNKEILLDPRNPELSPEQRSALSQLRQRLTDRNMADHH